MTPSPVRLSTPTPAPTNATIDFRRSLPPVPAELHVYLKTAFDNVAARNDLGDLTHQSIPRGAEVDRIAGASFLAGRFGQPVDPSRLLITNGTQSAVVTLLKGVMRRGGLMVAERLSYAPVPLLAELASVQLQGLDIDGDGIIPDSFEHACRTSKPKVLYCNPTVQNPTTAIMPMDRRLAIAEIARRHGVMIIEDEALGRLHLDAPRPIAAVAPDVTWYVMSTTKCLSHGLRLAYLVAPSAEAAARVIGPVEHLSYWHPTPLVSAMVTDWIDSGVADKITSAIGAECLARETAAREILAGFALISKPGSMHVWLNLPEPWRGTEFMEFAERNGILLRSSELFAVDPQPRPNAIRLSLSTPDSTADVRRGLEHLRGLLDSKRG